jgi:hypothetical protein
MKLFQGVSNYKGRTRFVSVDINLNRLENIQEKAQYYLDSQVLIDCQDIVPIDTGNLRATGIENTVFGSGDVVWGGENAPYAIYVYDNEEANHPIGSYEWFEVAKATHKDSWIDGVQKIYGG